jgi:hypothetical protein
MRKQGGGFGFVMLLVVLAAVFYAAMKNMKAVAPAAMDVQKHNKRREMQQGDFNPPDDAAENKSSSADSWTPAPPSRPNLQQMDAATTQHSNDVQKAISQPE